MRGIVVEIDENKAVVLTKEGSFQKINRDVQRLSVGQEIEIPLSEILPDKTRPKWRSLTSTVAMLVSSLFLVVALLGGYMLWPDKNTVAYVQLDLNPGIELSVNKEMEVLSMTGSNAEGEHLIQYVEDWSHHSLSNVIVNLLITAQDQGYLGKMTHVLVTTAIVEEYAKEEEKQRLVEALQKAEGKLREAEGFYVYSDQVSALQSQDAPEAGNQVIFYQIDADAAWREEAKESGLTLGKYAILLHAQEQGLDLSVDELHHRSVAELANELDRFTRLQFKPQSGMK